MENKIKGKDGTQQSWKETPLYSRSAEYAREHNELSLYRDSYRANIACKEAIEDAIHANYADNCLNSKAVSARIKEQFGMERMVYVLANTVREKDWDGRISRDNKAWAETIPVCKETDAWRQDRNCCFVVNQAHTGLVDLLVTHVRGELAKAKEQPVKKPSVLKKLQRPAAKAERPPAGRPKKSKEPSL